MKLAADANVLLAAILGGRARSIFGHAEIEVFTTAETWGEVQEYVPLLAQKRGLRLDLALLAMSALPVTVLEPDSYRAELPEAIRRIGERDPDDAPLLALALTLKIPVWSNDKDFSEAGVEWHTTESLLRHLRAAGESGV